MKVNVIKEDRINQSYYVSRMDLVNAIIEQLKHTIIENILTRAHVLMYGDESRNEVLLNDEVRFLAHIITKEGKEPKLGPVTNDDISYVAGLYPSQKNDPNAAHIMLLRIREKWYHAFDFVYNGKIARNKLDSNP